MTRILLIDNYDSFTFNLHHQLARVAGVAPTVIRNDALDLDGVRALAPDAIVLSPGPGSPDVPSDIGVCAGVLEHSDVPVLGVCLGFQALIRAAGGQVGRVTPVHGLPGRIVHAGTDLFAGLPPGFSAIRYHSLGAWPPLPEVLELTGWAPDGLPMAVRHRERPHWGVQFHPESVCTEYGDDVIAAFLKLAERHVAHRRPARGRRLGGVTAGLPPASPSPAPIPAEHSPGLATRVHARLLGTTLSAEDLFVGLYGDAAEAFWLDSSLTGTGAARFSFVGARRPGGTTLSYDVARRVVTVRRGDATEKVQGTVLDVLESELAAIRTSAPWLDLPFVGGFVGYLGYEVGADCEGRLDALAAKRGGAEGAPDAYWMLADRVLAVDHDSGAVHAVALAADGCDAECQRWLDEIETAVARLRPVPAPATGDHPAAPLVLRLGRDPADYLADVAACQEAIRAGESYELCLTTQAELPAVARPLDLYRTLRRVSPAPYAAYLRCAGVSVLCSSPERFLTVDADGTVTSTPMKGTIGRHPDPDEDAARRRALGTGAKDRSENLMIVDLLRNDLSRVCELGSVTVPELMHVQTYATVHQLVSTVRGRLRPGLGVLDCVRAAFPGGSMTGAPKLRSMQILNRLEPLPRGIYSGSLGYLGVDGRADLNIVIRTAVATPDRTSVGLGGAVVALSSPEAELAETVLKAHGILRAVLALSGEEFDADAFRVLGPEGDAEPLRDRQSAE